MKYKYLTKEQIILSLDRLTRFKYTKDKYLRVFTDVILNCQTEPVLRKADIYKMNTAELTETASEIINNSILKYTVKHKAADYLNNYIRDYENTVFINDNDTQTILNNYILYNVASELIPDNTVINLRWLKMLAENPHITDYKALREKYALKYPLEKIVLAEGITEEILLPAFGQYLGDNFDKKGIQIIPAGGKNQVVKMYYKLTEEVKLPIFILLDKDAEENIKQIRPKLRDNDKIHLVSCGEFEDLLPKSLVVKTVNNHFRNFLTITESDLLSEISAAKVLSELFRTKGLHEFKKAEFAKLVKDNINTESDISDEIRSIVTELCITDQ